MSGEWEAIWGQLKINGKDIFENFFTKRATDLLDQQNQSGMVIFELVLTSFEAGLKFLSQLGQYWKLAKALKQTPITKFY